MFRSTATVRSRFKRLPNEKRICVARGRDIILGWTKSGHARCGRSSYRVSASDTGALNWRRGRSTAVCGCGGQGCAWRHGCCVAPVTCGYGRSATRRPSRPTGVLRLGAKRGVSGVVMAAGSTTVGARRCRSACPRDSADIAEGRRGMTRAWARPAVAAGARRPSGVPARACDPCDAPHSTARSSGPWRVTRRAVPGAARAIPAARPPTRPARDGPAPMRQTVREAVARRGREEPLARPMGPPVVAQSREERRRQRDVAIAVPLAVHVQQHPAAVDLGDLDPRVFEQPAAARVDRRQASDRRGSAPARAPAAPRRG